MCVNPHLLTLLAGGKPAVTTDHGTVSPKGLLTGQAHGSHPLWAGPGSARLALGGLGRGSCSRGWGVRGVGCHGGLAFRAEGPWGCAGFTSDENKDNPGRGGCKDLERCFHQATPWSLKEMQGWGHGQPRGLNSLSIFSSILTRHFLATGLPRCVPGK